MGQTCIVSKPEEKPEQFDLFTDYDAVRQEREQAVKEDQKEKSLQHAMIAIKHKFGKNAILKGSNLQEGAMTIERNHNRGEDIMNNPYADIIDLPHHVSKRHPQMPMEKRAAQFSPFAAVSGHDEAIHETAMLTEDKLELYEDEMNAIDEKLRLLQYHIKEQLKVTVAYFKPDEAKNGGAYVTVTGSAKKVDDVSKMLLLQDGKVIPIKDIQMLQNLSR